MATISKLSQYQQRNKVNNAMSVLIQSIDRFSVINNEPHKRLLQPPNIEFELGAYAFNQLWPTCLIAGHKAMEKTLNFYKSKKLEIL